MSAIPARLYTFVGCDAGPWRVTTVHAVSGDAFARPPAIAVIAGTASAANGWSLRGIVSNERYVARDEKAALVARQEGLGRPGASCAALIPIRKSPAWWALAQDERRDIFEAQSHHIATGLRYLPAVARRLHHCRDLGPDEPFDFLTWFEYGTADVEAFDEMLCVLRASPEWRFVEREVDFRLERR